MDKENLEKGWDLWRFCVSDEHYVPTLLAVLGLDDQTDCKVHTPDLFDPLHQIALYSYPKLCTKSSWQHHGSPFIHTPLLDPFTWHAQDAQTRCQVALPFCNSSLGILDQS